MVIRKKLIVCKHYIDSNGTVSTVSDLSLIKNANIGDVYKCKTDLKDYIWNGKDWVDVGENIDFTSILKEIRFFKKYLAD